MLRCENRLILKFQWLNTKCYFSLKCMSSTDPQRSSGPRSHSESRVDRHQCGKQRLHCRHPHDSYVKQTEGMENSALSFVVRRVQVLKKLAHLISVVLGNMESLWIFREL